MADQTTAIPPAAAAVDAVDAVDAASPEEPQLKEFTLDEVKAHNTAEDCWMIIGEEGDRKVYDVTAFLDDHPGGPEIMVDLAGQDATAEFEDIGHSNDARAQLVPLCVGKVKGDVKKVKAVSVSGKIVNGRQDVSGNNGPLFVVLAGIIGIVAFFLQFGRAE